MLYRWDEDVNQYRSITGPVIQDSSRDIWADPGGMDLPTWQDPGAEQEARTNK